MMNEDYLWNRIGQKIAEIEKLENALKAFRYQEIAPPELPAKIIPFETKNRRADFLDLVFCIRVICSNFDCLSGLLVSIFRQQNGNCERVAESNFAANYRK